MTKFSANTVDEFMDKAAKKYGGDDLGDTEAHPSFSYGGFKDGKITKLVFVCPVDVDYAEFGSGKPDANNKKAILEVARLTKAHELSHQSSYEKAFKDWDAGKVAKNLMAGDYASQKDADAACKNALDDLEAELLKACLNLHKKEGLLDVVKQKDGSFKVTMTAAGANGCK